MTNTTNQSALAASAEPMEPVGDDATMVDLWAEIHRLRAAVKGPDGYASWQDAAVDERIRRVRAEKALATPPAQAEPSAQEPAEVPHIELGHGNVEVAEGTYAGLHALIFGRHGTGVIGEATTPDREHQPGETLAAVTFTRAESIAILIDKLEVIRKKMAPVTTPTPQTSAQEPDVPDIIAGALQCSRAYAYTLMERALAERNLQSSAQEPVGIELARQVMTAVRAAHPNPEPGSIGALAVAALRALDAHTPTPQTSASVAGSEPASIDEVSAAPWQLLEMARRVVAAYRDHTLDYSTIFYLQDMVERAEKLPIAARDVLAERRRQITSEGYVHQHDDEHTRGEISNAAAEWLMTGQAPSGESWAKDKAKHTRRRQLVIGSALALAEIERYDRATQAAPVAPAAGARACRQQSSICEPQGVLPSAGEPQPQPPSPEQAQAKQDVQAVPEGFVLVPKELDGDRLHDAWRAAVGKLDHAALRHVYATMIATPRSPPHDLHEEQHPGECSGRGLRC